MAFTLSLATSKSSICVFLLGLIKNSLHNKPKRIFLYSTIGLLFFTTVISFCLILATCQPTPKIWNPTIPGTCENYNLQIRFSYFSGSQSALSRFPDENCSTDAYQRWQPGSISHLQPFRYLLSKTYKSVKRRRSLYGAYCLSACCRCPSPVLFYCSLTLMTVHDYSAGICAVTRTVLGSSLSNKADITCKYHTCCMVSSALSCKLFVLAKSESSSWPAMRAYATRITARARQHSQLSQHHF